MNQKLVLVAFCLLCVMVMSLGCDVGSPSDENIKEAILKRTASLSNYDWVREVEVLDVGRPYVIQSIMGDYKYWPTKVYLIGGGRTSEARVEVYKDEWGEWKAGPPLLRP